MSNEDRLRDIEAQWATLQDVTLPILRRQVREADDKAQDAIWRFPKNAKASVPQGHVHPFDAGGGLIHFDIIVDAAFGHPDGTAVVLYSGQTVLLYNDIEAAVAYANASRQTTGQNTSFWINTGDYTISASMTVDPPTSGIYGFYGSGRDSVIIRPGTSLSSGSMITHNPLFSTISKVYYHNLTFSGKTSAGSNKNIALVSGGTSANLFFSDCRFLDGSGSGFDPGTGTLGSYLVNCDFYNCTGDGIGQSPASSNESALGVRAVNCSFYGCGTGVRIRGAVADGLFYLSNCLFNNSTTRDVYYLKATNYAVIFDECEFNAEVTIDADTVGTLAGNGLLFSNCYFNVASGAYGIAFIAAAAVTGSASALKGFAVTSNVFVGTGTAIGVDGGKVTGGYSAPTGNPTDGMISNNTFVGFTSGSEIKNWSTNGALSFHNISDGGALADTGAPYGHAAAATAASNAESFVVMALSSGLSGERVLTAGSNITITDNGVNSTVVIAGTAAVGISEDAGASLGNLTKIDFGGGFDVSFAAGVGTVTHDVDESPLSGLAKLVGRSGGQSLAGDTLTTGNLTLRANQADTTGTVIILSNVKMGTAATTIQDSGATARIALATASPHTTLTGDTQVTGGLGVNSAPATVAAGQIKSFVSATLSAGTDFTAIDFAANPTFNTTAVTNFYLLNATGTFTVTGITLTNLYGLNFQSTVSFTSTPTVTNITMVRASLGFAGTGTIGTAISFDSVSGLWGSGQTFTNIYHFRSKQGTIGTPTITTHIGLRVESMTKGTNIYPIWADGPATTTQGSAIRNSVQIGSLTRDYGGGDGVIGLTNATTAPTANPTTGTVLASVGQQLVQRGLMSVNEPMVSTVAALAAGTAYNTSTTETALNNAIFTFPANALVAGSVWRLTARGVYGTATATTPTFDMRCRWGGVAGVLLGDSGANNMGLGVTNLGWKVEFTIRVVSIGATGTFEAQGEFAYATSVIALNDAYMVNTAVVTVDTTASKDLVLTGQWGTNAATNTIIVRNFIVERVS